MEQPLPTSFGRSLRAARTEAGLSQARLAELLRISTRMLRHYEAGTKSPTLERLPAIARATGKPVGWFFREPPLQAPLYDEVPAGPSREAPQQVQGWLNLPLRWMKGRGEVYCLRVRGRSMEPLLLDGDIVAVRRQSEAEHGHIVVATTPDGEYTVKRLVRTEAGARLKSENPAYAEAVPKGAFCIDGRVIGLLREL